MSELNAEAVQKKEVLKELQLFNNEKVEEIFHLEDIHGSLKKRLYETANQSIHKLITELETGGNIRLEEGKSNEKWYISCVDLIKSRFHPEDMG